MTVPSGEAKEREPAGVHHAAHLPGGDGNRDVWRRVGERVGHVDRAAGRNRRELLADGERGAGELDDGGGSARQLDDVRRSVDAPRVGLLVDDGNWRPAGTPRATPARLGARPESGAVVVHIDARPGEDVVALQRKFRDPRPLRGVDHHLQVPELEGVEAPLARRRHRRVRRPAGAAAPRSPDQRHTPHPPPHRGPRRASRPHRPFSPPRRSGITAVPRDQPASDGSVGRSVRRVFRHDRAELLAGTAIKHRA